MDFGNGSAETLRHLNNCQRTNVIIACWRLERYVLTGSSPVISKSWKISLWGHSVGAFATRLPTNPSYIASSRC